MTANQDAAREVLNRMGVSADDMIEALGATESVVTTFHPPDGTALTAEWECAAEFVGTFAAITGATGMGLRQVTSLARAAYKLQRF